jgi:hypothetical protein
MLISDSITSAGSNGSVKNVKKRQLLIAGFITLALGSGVLTAQSPANVSDATRALSEFTASVKAFGVTASTSDCSGEDCARARQAMLDRVSDDARRFLRVSPDLRTSIATRLKNGTLSSADALEATTHLKNFERLANTSIDFAEAMHRVAAAHTMKDIQDATNAARIIRTDFEDAFEAASADYKPGR